MELRTIDSRACKDKSDPVVYAVLGTLGHGLKMLAGGGHWDGKTEALPNAAALGSAFYAFSTGMLISVTNFSVSFVKP